MSDEAKCEECGAVATVFVADQREIEPEVGTDNELYSRWELTERHAYCDTHARPSRKIYREIQSE